MDMKWLFWPHFVCAHLWQFLHLKFMLSSAFHEAINTHLLSAIIHSMYYSISPSKIFLTQNKESNFLKTNHIYWLVHEYI